MPISFSDAWMSRPQSRLSHAAYCTCCSQPADLYLAFTLSRCETKECACCNTNIGKLPSVKWVRKWYKDLLVWTILWKYSASFTVNIFFICVGYCKQVKRFKHNAFSAAPNLDSASMGWSVQSHLHLMTAITLALFFFFIFAEDIFFVKSPLWIPPTWWENLDSSSFFFAAVLCKAAAGSPFWLHTWPRRRDLSPHLGDPAALLVQAVIAWTPACTNTDSMERVNRWEPGPNVFKYEDRAHRTYQHGLLVTAEFT